VFCQTISKSGIFKLTNSQTTQQVTFKVYSVTGSLMKEIYTRDNQITELDLTDLQNGIFLLQKVDEKEITVQKIIKE
jgi:hypothetical protein